MNEVARNNIELGTRIKALRTEKGLTMDMFVWDINTKYDIDLNKGLVSRWENGINEPSLRYAGYLARYYDVSLDYLIGLTDVKTPARLLAYANKQRSSENDSSPRIGLTEREALSQDTVPVLHKTINGKEYAFLRYENGQIKEFD